MTRSALTRTACALGAIAIAGAVAACGDETAEPGVDTGTQDTTDAAPESDAAATDATESDVAAADATDDAAAPDVDISAWPMPPDTTPVGGDRPAKVTVPDGYTNEQEWPLLVMLHGYGANGLVQQLYFNLSDLADDLGFVLIYPDGTENANGDRFWNAWVDCCGFGSDVDDAGYLIGLLDEAEARYRIDTDRVFFIGHSNGGFMSYRMACEHSDRVTGIMSLAGAMPNALGPCEPEHEVAVLQVHGTADETVPYDPEPGNPLGAGAYDSAAFWADLQGCDAEPVEGTALDIYSAAEGAETTVTEWTGCSAPVALWTIQDGVHIPPASRDLSGNFMPWLLENGAR